MLCGYKRKEVRRTAQNRNQLRCRRYFSTKMTSTKARCRGVTHELRFSIKIFNFLFYFFQAEPSAPRDDDAALLTLSL